MFSTLLSSSWDGFLSTDLILRLKNLKKLLLKDNPDLKNLSGISGLDNLELLGIRNCKSLTDLSYVSGFKKLTGIQVNNCGITSTNGLKNLPFKLNC